MIIRPETPADYADIADVHVRAFGQRANEAMIVSLHRHRRAFDPELSLVAEVEGRVVGHALFNPQTVRLMGEDVRAVNLAPLAVDPAFQGQGIGGALLEAGHSASRDKGYTLSFLLGHPGYYTRFGYRTRAFGGSSLTVMTSGPAPIDLDARSPKEEDLPALQALWRYEEGDIDFAIAPGPDLLDWLNLIPTFEATVYRRHEEIVGYTRGPIAERRRPRMFLAQDAAIAHAMVNVIAQSSEIVLPLHPLSASASVFGITSCGAWDAAMALALAPGPFDDYYARVQSGSRPPGRPIWPVAFDVD